MKKKSVTRKMTAFLLAAAMCVSLCTEFTANAQEVSEGTQQQAEEKEHAGQTGQSKEAEQTGSSMPKGEENKETNVQKASGADNDKAGTADAAKDTIADATTDTTGKNEAGVSETSEEQQSRKKEDEENKENTEAIEAQEVSEQADETAAVQEMALLSASGLNNPRIEKDSSMTAEQKVTWDCVWFGSYPQAEVVPSANDYTAVDKSMRKSGDIIEDSGLYNKLKSASGWNTNNDITLDGNQYRRMKKSDATYAPSGSSSYYNWSDYDTYHYFKYEPIKWRVLKVNGNQAFLLSDIALDDQRYHTVSESITWETSTIRSWLNGYGASSNKQGKDYSSKNFIGSAFSGNEKSAIVNTSVVNDNNINYGTEGGNNTTDKIFLLSESEVYGDNAVTHGFVSSYNTYDEARRCKSSIYAKAMGTYSSTSNAYKGNCWWWLRSPGIYAGNAAHVSYDGCINSYGNDVHNDIDGVRAALNLNLSSNLYTYAGTVSSDGTKNEVGGGSSTEPETPTNPTEKKYKENIIKALPNMSNLGSATLKGPEISIVGNKFNLFQTDMNMSLPFWGNVEVQADESKKTVKVLIGTKGKGLSTENDDAYWTNTYKDVKSFVQKCGGTVDTTKLWNQFSSMRGKLKEFDANAVFKAKGNVAGYMELQMNDDGSIKNILEGGIAAGFNAGASVRAPLWWIVYSEFGIGGSVDGKLYLTTQNTKAITAKGEIGLAIKPSIALGADVVIADVKGGLEGTIAGKVTFPWRQFQESVYAYMTGKLFIKVDTVVPGLSGEFPYNFPKMELYPNLGNVTRDFSELQYSAPKPVSSQMVKKMSKNSRNSVDTTRESLVYENAEPEMAALPDGRLLMTYLDDTSEQAKLSYRLYNGGQWSESKTVWDGGNLDTAGYLYQHNGSAYVIFESSNQEITKDMVAEQIAGAMELYVAKLAGDAFEEPVRLGTGATWKYAYQLVEHSGALCAVWAENSENDIMLQSGQTVIYESSLNGTWQEPSQIADIGQVLTETVSGTVGGTFVTAYIKDGQIYIKDQLLDAGSAGEKADSLRIQDGVLYTRIDGMLYAYDGEQLKAENVECTASYQVYGNTVYWIQQNNFKSEVLSQPLGSGAGPVAVTDEGGYVGGFTMAQNAQGKPVFAYTYQPVSENAGGNPYGATILKCTEDITRCQAEVTNAAYDILSFVPGKGNPIHVTICNTGTETLSNVQLVISDGDKVIYSGKAAESLKAGESKECEIAVQIPEDFSKSDLLFALTADQQFKKEAAKKYEFEYCDTDIEVAENGIDEIAVKNNSQTTASNVTVILRDQNENGAEIRKITVGNLKSGESKIISVNEDWKKVTEYMYCRVTQDADEYELWNNSLVMKKQGSGEDDGNSGDDGNGGNNGDDGNDGNGGNNGGNSSPNVPGPSQESKNPPAVSNPKTPVKVAKITLSGISKKIAAGKKIKLTASIKPSNAVNKKLIWKSSNTKVATVNSKGVVTIKKKTGGKKVTITATATDGSKVKATYKITSMKGVVKKVDISGKKTVKAGKTLKLKAKVTASKKANKTLKWTSSNKKYATVSSSGKVKALKAGKGKKVKITAMATDGSGKKKSVTIKIK